MMSIIEGRLDDMQKVADRLNYHSDFCRGYERRSVTFAPQITLVRYSPCPFPGSLHEVVYPKTRCAPGGGPVADWPSLRPSLRATGLMRKFEDPYFG
jgi:hypothetical protein